ncbi:uncharacterized protein Gasu_65310 [Galdieria sulphuraria]|uniref:Uncharacterized protein n=1 Tax=Galdieria sulphuraria TaxID=130081 RepID=M2WPV7_GALSU|nr:uncharacterized protein Gasu_65310 [Galdieria sulphuraria]EME25810.1 hypothetical protein Gasu_65310 [Galdieria sulphuraria]|eukprot:XP_005702330.1 hypothetical protein Gasu_65310 [Galdieria sulphuraria]
MAIFKSTQSPLDWPSSPISSNPFPHPFSPIAISPPISNYPFFPSPPQWQFPKHDHLCGWPKLAPFPTHFPPWQFPHSLPFPPIYPFFPSPPQWQFPKHDHLWGWPKLAPFPTHFPLGNFPTLSHFQFTHSFPPHTHNGNFQIKIARAHS